MLGGDGRQGAQEQAADVGEDMGKGMFILSLLYQDCELTPFPRDLVYADFRSSYDTGLKALPKRIDPPIKSALFAGLMSGTTSVITLSYAKIETLDRE